MDTTHEKNREILLMDRRLMSVILKERTNSPSICKREKNCKLSAWKAIRTLRRRLCG
jgi:hypothetical protein